MTEPIDVRDRGLYGPDELCVDARYRDDIEGVLLTHGEIRDRVAKLAADVSDRYRGEAGALYPLCVLKGAMRFYVDLVRELELDGPISEGIVHSSRYHGGATSDTAEVQFFQPEAIEDAHVLLVEDILDEGYTLDTLVDRVAAHDPRSVEVVTLFDKAKPRDVDVDPAFDGFRIPDSFVVGYGLDYDERYRDLPHLAVLDESTIGD